VPAWLLRRGRWLLQLPRRLLRRGRWLLQLPRRLLRRGGWLLQLSRRLLHRGRRLLQLSRRLLHRGSWLLQLSRRLLRRGSWLLQLPGVRLQFSWSAAQGSPWLLKNPRRRRQDCRRHTEASAYSIVMFPFAVSRSRRQPPPLIVPVMFSCESEPLAVTGSSERMEPKLVRA
jgi:hypothetical protein